MSNWDEIDITTPDPEETEPNENENTTPETENSGSDTPGFLGGPLGGGLTLGLGASPAALTSTGNDLGEENESGRLTWDGTGKRFYENGVDHGILFVSNGDGTYRNGIVWNGLTTVTESPDGAEPNDLWADNMKYATLYSNETFGATIEAYTYPDEFSECDGSYEPMPGVYYGQQDRKPFAFCYRTHVGNDTGLNAYKLHIVYNCKASPSEKSYETINDSPDAITFSWEVSTIPVPHGNIKPISTITIDESKLDERGLEIYYELLDKLYGSDNSPSTLPSTDEIAEMFGTYEGNPVVFKATKPTPLSKTIIHIEPAQEGSGDPSPDNVRAISGYDSVSVTRKSANLCPLPSHWPNNTTTSSSVTFTVQDDGGIKVQGTAGSSNAIGELIQSAFPLDEGKYVCFLAESDSGVKLQLRRNSSGGAEQFSTSNTGTTTTGAATFTESINIWARLIVEAGTTVDTVVYPMILASEKTPTMADFIPYKADTYTVAFPESDPGTVYGGTLDMNTGELEVTYGYIESYSGQTLTGKWVSDRDVYSEGTSPTTGAEVAYELAEPQTYQLTSQQMSILSLAGTNIMSTDASNTLEITYREDVGAAASSGYTKQQLLNLSDPLYVKNLVRIGTAEQVFDIGDQFNVTWNDGENTYDCPFDVVHFGKVINKHGQEVNAMYLQSHWALPGVQFDASEAIYYADEAMPAGTYYFTIGDNWNNNDKGFYKNDVYAFTTTQVIPQGGQVLIGSSTSPYTWGGDSTIYSSWKVYTYSSKEATTPIETLTISQGEPVGSATNLGTIASTINYGDTGLNNLWRASRGYNRWSQSGVRQWLNSDAASGSWWTAQNNYDRPPEQLSTKSGFMAGLPTNFLSLISPFKVRTLLNGKTDSDIGEYETVEDTFSLASLEQEYFVPEKSGVEGEAFEYWKNVLEIDTPQQRGINNPIAAHARNSLTDHSNKLSIRTRSPYLNDSRRVWYIHYNGHTVSYDAAAANALCPICVVY